jgi:hypothetical protein
MKTPHKHAALIKAWADGAEIEKQANTGEWFIDYRPDWHEYGEYRIKPEPKPDVPYSLCLHLNTWGELDDVRLGEPNLKLTFNGETGKLKFAEVIA